MDELLTPADLAPFAEIETAKAEAMIGDALALAGEVAPCLGDEDLDEKKARAAKAILRAAVLRWNESGQGMRSLEPDVVGPFQYPDIGDKTPRRPLLWPSEIAQLQRICATGRGAAWSYDTAGGSSLQHGDTCAVNLGAAYCDCGAIYTGGGPLWGSDPDV